MIIDQNNKFDFNFLWHNQYEAMSGEIADFEKIRISRIGFNDSQTMAIFFLEIMGVSEGSGKTYLFENKDGQWNIMNIIDGYGMYRAGILQAP